jgi:hypothetical protein
MDPRLVLLADDWTFEELRRSGVLPEPFYVDGPVLRIDPSELVVSATDADAREHSDLLFASLLGPSQLCRVAVLGEGDPAEPSPVRALLDWYDGFEAACRDHLGGRGESLAHALVLIVTADVPQDWREDLERLLSDPDAGPRGPVYLMGRRLNWSASDVCHARHVWPIAASRLLLRFLAEPVDPNQQRKRVHAWRSYALQAMRQADFDLAVDAALRGTHQGLLDELSEHSGWDSGAFGAVPAPPRRSEPDVPEPGVLPGSWIDYRGGEQLAHLIDGEARAREEARAGHATRAAASETLLATPPAISREVSRLWKSVHGSPAFVERALSDQALLAGPDLAQRLQRSAGELRGVIAAEEELAESVDDASACAELLEDAQLGYVELVPRLWIALSVSLLVGWTSFHVLGAMTDSWRLPALLTGAGIVGSLLASLLPLMIERAAGRRAVAAFHEGVLGDVPARTRTLHLKKLSVGDHARNFHAALTTFAAGRRVVFLLERMRAVLNARLVAVESEVAAVTGGEAELATEAVRKAQQATFRRETERVLDGGPSGVDPAEIEGLIRDECTHLLEEWPTFAARVDPLLRGNFPAGEVAGFLERFRTRFRARLSRRVHRALLGDADASTDVRFGDALREIGNHAFRYTASLAIENKDRAGDLRQLWLVPSDLEHRDLVPLVPRHSPDMDGLFVLAYLFEEIAVDDEFVSRWLEGEA